MFVDELPQPACRNQYLLTKAFRESVVAEHEYREALFIAKRRMRMVKMRRYGQEPPRMLIDDAEYCFIADHVSYWLNRETMLEYARKLINTALLDDIDEMIDAHNKELKEYYDNMARESMGYTKIQKTEGKSIVYVMKCGDCYKIGVSKHPNARLKQLDERPFPVEIVMLSKMAEYPYDIEKELHDALADKRIGGEWFKLDHKDLVFIYDYFGSIGVEDEAYNPGV